MRKPPLWRIGRSVDVQEVGGALEGRLAVPGSGLARWALESGVSRAEERHCVEEPAFKHNYGICGRRAIRGKSRASR